MKMLKMSYQIHGVRAMWWATLACLTSSCFGATTAEQRYYTMSLPTRPPPPECRQDAELLLNEVEISPVYNRPQIVYRFSPQEMQFFHQNNWADRPSRMIGQLVSKAFITSGIFRSVVSRLGAKPPAYVLHTSVQAIEELQGGDVWFAHLAMTFRLARFDDNRAVWQYTFDERRPLNKQDLGLVVRAMSEILDEQMNLILPQIDALLAGKPAPVAPPVTPPAVITMNAAGKPATGPPIAGIITLAGAVTPDAVVAELGSGPRLRRPPSTEEPLQRTYDGTNGTHVEWRKSTQYTSDSTAVPAGKGAIFLPSLSNKADREPPVIVLQGGKLIATGTMGRRIPVPAGRFQVSFGSGPAVQHLVRTVDVVEGQTNILTPDWATLDVAVVNAKFIPFLGTYEIIRMEDREYMGIGYGVNDELGQQSQVWALRPGLYKVVQTGSTYRARINFSTVRLTPGMAVPFTLVQDELTRDFLGAGVAEVDPNRGTNGPHDVAGKWTFRSALGGSILLTNRTEGYSSAPVGSSLGIDLFADSRLRFASDPHLWTTRLEFEEGQMLQPTIGADNKPGSLLSGRLQSVKDRVYFNSIYIYQYLPWVGPYLRIGGETTLFNQHAYFEKPTTVVVENADGAPTATYSGSDGKGETRFALTGPLSPIQLKQGIGVNFRILHNAIIDLNLRSGFGSRQYLARGQLVSQDDAATPAFEMRQVANSVLTGMEISALSQARLTRYLQASTELDALLPFDGLGSTQLTWRNLVSLRLSGFAALTYALNVVRQPNVRPDKPFATEQGLQLRFFYAPW